LESFLLFSFFFYKNTLTILLTPTQESSRVRRLSLRIADPRPKDDQGVDHRVESFADVSMGVLDDGFSMTRPTTAGVASLKQGLSKAYASSTISGSVTRTRCLPAKIYTNVTFSISFMKVEKIIRISRVSFLSYGNYSKKKRFL